MIWKREEKRSTQVSMVYCTVWNKVSTVFHLSIDKDECMTNNNICGPGICENLPDSYRCTCNQGYKYDETLKKCVGQLHINFFKILMLLQHLLAWDRPSIFSSEIVEPAYGNKNCGGFFYPRLAQEGLAVTFTRNYWLFVVFCILIYEWWHENAIKEDTRPPKIFPLVHIEEKYAKICYRVILQVSSLKG